MKKIYMTPIASFEAIENESLLFDPSKAIVTEETQSPSLTTEISVFDNPADPSQGGGMSEVVSGETDD